MTKQITIAEARKRVIKDFILTEIVKGHIDNKKSLKALTFIVAKFLDSTQEQALQVIDEVCNELI